MYSDYIVRRLGVSYITECLTRPTRRFPLEEQDIFTLPEYQRSSTIFLYRVRVAQCLLFCVKFCGSRLVSFFNHSIIRPSSIDGFWLPFISILNPHLLNEAVFVLTISADIRNARHWSTLFVCFTLFVSSHDLQCYTVYWYHFASVHRLFSVVTIAHIYNLSWNHLEYSK